ncbi:chitin deacetylase family protein [Scytonema sp. NUACC26]|uniref:chitin deacetylase family protein n=1 Tax=Scytonema sp. NUACC26 TaxID=3140176 RepID=UPI0038B3BDCE
MIPGAIYFAETSKLIVALTIDDGPDAITTPKILEVLQSYEARATFFLISNRVKDNESVVAEIVANKNELGNHLTEDKPSIKLSPQEFESDLLEANISLSRFAKPYWLRPASGLYNTTMVETAQKYGYHIVLGSLFPFDTHIHSSWFASKHILFNVRPGSIIVLHDGGSRGRRTALTLETILPELNRRGYRVVTLSELFREVKDFVNHASAR